jgi:hypothetical protein
LAFIVFARSAVRSPAVTAASMVAIVAALAAGTSASTDTPNSSAKVFCQRAQ